MRKGMRPSMVLSPKGELFAIATGSDATAEHEWGCDELLLELTGHPPLSAKEAAKQLHKGLISEVPDLLTTRRISQDLNAIQYQEGVEDGEPVAAIGYSARGGELCLLTHNELRFNHFSEPKDQVGAWSELDFGFKVKGAKLVAQLKRFHQALLEGKGLFAGLFLSGKGYSGIVICNGALLRPEHRAEIKTAQGYYDARVQAELQLLAKASQP